MAWVKLDTGIFRNPKVVTVGADAKLLYVAGICYAGDNLTDGLIPANALPILAAEATIRNVKKATAELVNAGLWVTSDTGFEVHDYLEHNSRSGDVQAKRDAARERMQRNRSQNVRANKSRSSQEVRPTKEIEIETEEEIVGDKSPTPPAREKKTAVRIDYPVEFESFWQVYPSGHGVKKATYEHWKRIAPDAALAQTIVDAVHGWMQSDKWRRGFVMDAENFLKRQAWDSVPPPQSATNITRIEAPARYPSERVGRDGLTDAERGWRENPGHKGWSADELMRMANAMEQQERERNSA